MFDGFLTTLLLVVLIPVSLFFGAAYVWGMVLRSREDESRRIAEEDAIRAVDEMSAAVRRAVNEHAATLLRKQERLIYKDDYGRYVFHRWNKERDYFLDNVVRLPHPIDGPEVHLLFSQMIDDELELLAPSLEREAGVGIPVEELESISPVEYEQRCADLVVAAGWEATTTDVTGDQGADVLARIPEASIALQCKLYGAAVGNGAVQEVHAARSYYQTTYAVVVAPNGFTKSAQELAKATEVELLHHDDLGEFLTILKRVCEGQELPVPGSEGDAAQCRAGEGRLLDTVPSTKSGSDSDPDSIFTLLGRRR